MNGVLHTDSRRGLATLRRLLAPEPMEERCDLCAAALREDHQHLVEPAQHRLICACDACAILFSDTGQTKYRRVPRDVVSLPNFQIADEIWNALAIPIGLVFFFHSSISGNVVGVYPSPAGPTESIVDPDAWCDVAARNRSLEDLAVDVQALLVNRIQGAREYYLAPIDQCYKLTGLIRNHWTGFSGGEEAWTHIQAFFADLKQRSRPVLVPAHA